MKCISLTQVLMIWFDAIPIGMPIVTENRHYVANKGDSCRQFSTSKQNGTFFHNLFPFIVTVQQMPPYFIQHHHQYYSCAMQIRVRYFEYFYENQYYQCHDRECQQTAYSVDCSKRNIVLFCYRGHPYGADSSDNRTSRKCIMAQQRVRVGPCVHALKQPGLDSGENNAVRLI